MQKLFLLDSNSLINRAYYAMPNLTTRKGQFTGAIFGYVNMLLKMIDEYKPTHIIATFDRKAPTFRKKMYEGYKATRKGMPEELASQMQPLKDLLTAMQIPIVEMDGYEADDLIGTLSKMFDMPTFIVTGDRDSLQLIDDTTTVLLTKKGVTEIKYCDVKALAGDGLRPSQIIDLKSLMGDASDNIPGVAGIGEKTAMTLLDKYDTLDGVYANIDEIKGKLQEKLITNKDMAYLSYDLATINVHSPIEFNIDDAVLKLPFNMDVANKLKEFEFYKLVDRLNFESNGEVEEPKEEEKPIEIIKVDNIEALKDALNKVAENGKISLYLEDNITFTYKEDITYQLEISDNLFGEGIYFEDFINEVKPILEDPFIVKYLYDAKNVMHLLLPYNVSIQGYINDVLLKAYLCDSTRNYKNITEVIYSYNLSEKPMCNNIIVLDKVLNKEMHFKGLEKLYDEVERPLIDVLFDMEKNGFKIDLDILKELDDKFGEEINNITEEIIDLAGKPFNINSPKQLAEVLFIDLGLKGGKKTKTGYSTNVEVLEAIQHEHPIVPLVLRYRELAKLKSTYLEGIKPLIDGKGYVHTIFKQTVTATGRLSSTEPNLQNIPVRKPEGKQIRKMYVSSPGNMLVCADYSQIELRLMAHFSQDQTMIDAFNSGIDIHATTASKVFGIPIEEIDPDTRRQAKAVNFGIIYGISDFGLANDLNIPVWQARDFITKYFLKYPKIKEFMDKCVDIARKDGYSTTLLGRRRDIPELQSSNKNIQGFGERVAMNMPLQGSASDIIKMAMLKVAKALKDNKLSAKLIMQVHDELIIDTPMNEIEQVKKLLVDCMESVVKLDVKLTADVGIGNNWLEAK